MLRFILIMLVWLLAGVRPGAAQDEKHERSGDFRERLTPEAGPHFPLRDFVIPRSMNVEVNGASLDTLYFAVDARQRRLWIAPAVLDTTRDLIIHYRTIPVRGGVVYTLVDSALTEDEVEVSPQPAASGVEVDPFAGVALERRGSITRGVTTGSNRDVGVESGLRLELSGEVAEGVSVRAMLSDENTPILPEGTTRRVEEFDRVFIEIDAPPGTARLGDVDYRLEAGQFARLSRKLQGAAVESRILTGGNTLSGLRVIAAGAISRGQFRSQSINLIEGVQGPYRLTGAAGERFVLVIPGTERIYWDGILLERGEDRDYVIDYATGELSFTTNRIVAQERRVLAEFEYSSNQFTRTLLASHASADLWSRGDRPRVRLSGSVIREADGSRFLDEFGLTSEDSLRLAEAGDRPAYRSGAEQVPFDPEAPYVQYVRRDTLLDGEAVAYYAPVARAPEEGEAVYRVRFSTVADGSGSYERVGESINGIMYRFVGSGRGAYDPVRLLPAPSAKQLVDLNGSVELVTGLEVFGEWATSLFDQNRLSPLDAEDDRGEAYEMGLRLQPTIVTGALQLSGRVRRRIVGADFSPFDRIRPVEFERHWNIGAGATEAAFDRGRERMDEAALELAHEYVGEVQAEAARLSLGQWFEGRRGSLAGRLLRPGLPFVDYLMEHIDSVDELLDERGAWSRYRGQIRVPIAGGRLQPGLIAEHENRRQSWISTDSLRQTSFRFTQLTPGIGWTWDGLSGSVDVAYRTEDRPIGGQMEHAFDAWTASARAEFAASSLSGDARIGYRRRTHAERFTAHEGALDQTSLLLRTGLRWRPHPRAVEVAASYEATSERTPLLQEIFVRTGPEMGEYVWEDFNGDGIVQVDELIPERTPNEGVYARTYIPSDSLISSVSVNARAEVRLDGSAAWSSADGWRQILSRLSSRSIFEVQETTRDDELTRIYLLYLTRFRDPATTINGRLRIGQTISVFPRARRGGIDLNHNQVRTLTTRTAGGESRFFSTWSADGRWRIVDPLMLRLHLARERNRQDSEQFVSRRFDIHGSRIEPELSLQAADYLRISAPLALAIKDDAVAERSARVVRLPVELQAQWPSRLNLSARFETAYVRMRGESHGLSRYELTDGRGPGTSFLWMTSARYGINEYLRATLQYDGRAPEGAPVVHALRMQLSAVF